MADVVAKTFTGASDAKIANFTGQLWALRSRIQPEYLLVMPLKTTKQIALGRVTSGYEYRADEGDPERRHVVRVRWERADLPCASVKQDLLFTLGSAMSIFAPSKNQAVARLEHLLEHGTDPGQIPSMGRPSHVTGAPYRAFLETDEDVDEPELSADIEQVATDQITARITEEFAGHGLATLVSELLTADGSCAPNLPAPMEVSTYSQVEGRLGSMRPDSWSR